jgi:tetratricopeptide (TPR) repeat protein
MHYHLAYVYYKQGKYTKAIDPCRQLIALRPDKRTGYDYLGAIYFQLEMWPEATEIFEKSFTIDSTSPTAINNLGTLYFNQERYADAERVYRQALSISDEKYKVWAHLAEAQYWNPDGREESLGNFMRAAEMAEDSLIVDQQNPVILSDLASYYEKLGDDDRARKFLSRAISLDPQDTDVMLHIGETYEGLGERDIALDWIARALEKGTPPSRVERYPGLSQLRADSRYEELIEG